MKRILSLGAAALAAFVGGCGDGPSTVPGGYRNAATWSSFIYATRDGPLRLDLGGDPFGGNGPDLTQEVTKAMAGAIPGRPFTVTTLAAAAPLADLRVVMQLGAPANADARDLCAGRTREVRPPAAGGRIEVLAVFLRRIDLAVVVAGLGGQGRWPGRPPLPPVDRAADPRSDG